MMKKLLLNLLLFLFVSQISIAQSVIFFDDFQSGDITTEGWETYELTGQTSNYSPNYDDGWEVFQDPDNANDLAAASSSWFVPPGIADAWLISPAIEIEDNTYELDWFARVNDFNFPDGYQVLISTTGNTPADFTAPPIFTIAEENLNWTARSQSLAAYSGQTIHIAFRNNSNDRNVLFIDDVLVTRNLDFDVAVSDVFLSEYTAVPLSQVTPLTPSAEITNFGANTATNVTVDVNIFNEANALVFSTSMNQASLASGATTNLTSTTSFTPSAVDFYLAEYIVSINEADGLSSNDTLVTAIDVTDSLYARDFFYLTGNTDFLDGPWFLGNGNNGQLGNVFSVEADAEIVSATATFGGGFEIGDQTQANLYSMNGNSPGTLIASSPVLTVAVSDTPVIAYEFFFPAGTILSAGNNYLITMQQNAASSARFGLFSAVALYTPNTSFIRQNNNAWLEIDAAGIGEQTFMIRANLAETTTQTCEITNITAGTQTACNVADNTYTQQVTVTYSNPPTSGQLNVNGQTFNITSSPQTVTLTGLDSDGASVNVTAFFSVDPLCSITSNNLFTAPASCAVVPCEITDVTAGSQTVCNVADNTYTQQVTVTYSNPPASGQLSVNGQNFNITSSPQTVTLTGLDSDGASVNVTASFTADATCTLTSNNLFTAPASCQCPTINYSVSTEDDVCDQNTGCINVTGVSGGATPYTYSLDGGTSQSSGEFCSLASGSYDVTITDANNCDITFSVNVSADTYNLNVTVNTTSVNNCSSPDGTATANVSNGSSPYSYAWTPSTFGNNQTISNLPSGSYSVVVTDDNGCTGNASANVNNAAGVNAAIDNTENVSCFGGNDGEIAINTLGGTAPITYNWNDQGFPSTVSTRSNLVAGSYTITINDGAGCSFVLGPIQINEPNQLVVGLNNSENVTCFGGDNGSITMNVSGGTTPYDYSWSGSTATTLNLSNLEAGNYQLEVTDNNDCVVEGPQVTITQPTQLNIQLVSGSLEDVSCNGLSDGSFEVLASGGTAPYNYNIGGSNQASGLFDDLSEDDYTATVIDDNGCTNDVEIEIDEPNALSASIVNVQNASSASATDGSATVNVIGGTTPYEYVWTPSNEINASASQLSVGSNTVVVTDANDCSISRDVEISFTSSIQDLKLEDLKLFPVPASEQVSLQFNTSEKEISFRVVNTLGATIHAENIDTKSGVFAETLNVSNFASGVYFIHLVGKDKASSLSFVVNK